MEPSGIKRKLAVTLAADVEGITRFTRAAERAEDDVTLKTLGVYREIIDRLIARHDSPVFDAAGDSVLVEFDSGVEAVRCAISIQKALPRVAVKRFVN